MTPQLNASIERATILLIDDIPSNITLLSTMLGHQHQILFATNGVEGIEIAHQQQPDLRLLDIEMPDMDGYEVCRQLKSSPQTQGIAIIFITSHTDTAEEERGLQLGAIDYIHKPFSPLLVQLRVKTQLTLKQHRDQLETQIRETILMFQASVALIEHSLAGGETPINEIIQKISKRSRILLAIRRDAQESLQHQQTAQDEGKTTSTDGTENFVWCEKLLNSLTEKVASGCDDLEQTLDEAIVAFQNFDRITQQLEQVGKSLYATAHIVGDPALSSSPDEWKKMHEQIRSSFAMEDAQILFDSILSGEDKEKAMEKAGLAKQSSNGGFEAF